MVTYKNYRVRVIKKNQDKAENIFRKLESSNFAVVDSQDTSVGGVYTIAMSIRGKNKLKSEMRKNKIPIAVS